VQCFIYTCHALMFPALRSVLCVFTPYDYFIPYIVVRYRPKPYYIWSKETYNSNSASTVDCILPYCRRKTLHVLKFAQRDQPNLHARIYTRKHTRKRTHTHMHTLTHTHTHTHTQTRRSHFRPEFVNRVDDFITFEPLHKEQIKQIVVLTAQVSRARLWVCGKMRWQRKICKE